MFPSFLVKNVCNTWIRERPEQTIAEDATLVLKALHVLHRF